MPKKKRRKIEVFQHIGLGVDVQIYLDDEMVFSAEYGGESFEDRDGGKLKSRLRTAIEDANKIEWFHLMSIKHEADDREDLGELKLEIDRFYGARRGPFIYKANEAAYEYELEKEQKPDKDFPNRGPFGLRVVGRAQSWHGHPNRAGGDLCYVKHHPRSDDGARGSIRLDSDDYEIVMPFNQELWDGLQGVLRAIKAANSRIRELVGTPQGLALIASGQAMLMGPASNDQTGNPALHESSDLPSAKVRAPRR